MRQDYLNPEVFSNDLLHCVLELDFLELKVVAGVEEQPVGLEVVTHFPVGFPPSKQGEPRPERDMHRLRRFITVCVGGCDVAHLIAIVKPPNLIRQVEVHTLVCVFGIGLASRSIGHTREFSLEGRTSVDDLVIFSDGHVSPVRDIDDLLDLGELDLRVVVDSKHRMSLVCEGSGVASSEGDLCHSFLLPILVELAT